MLPLPAWTKLDRSPAIPREQGAIVGIQAEYQFEVGYRLDGRTAGRSKTAPSHHDGRERQRQLVDQTARKQVAMEPGTALAEHAPQLVLGEPGQRFPKINELMILLDHRDACRTKTVKIAVLWATVTIRTGPLDHCEESRCVDQDQGGAHHGEGWIRRKPFRDTEIPLPGARSTAR